MPRAAPLQTRPIADAAAGTAERLRILVAILLRHPEVLNDVGEAFASLALPAWLTVLRDAILDAADGCEVLDTATLTDHLSHSGRSAEGARALASVPMPLPSCAAATATPAAAQEGWWHFFGMLHRERLEEEWVAAREDYARNPNPTSQRKLVALSEARASLHRGEHDSDHDG
jgi:DNA primase